MKSTESAIEIDAPASVVFQEWSDFANLPDLLGMVDSIEPTSDPDVSTWTVSLGPVSRTFDARIAEVIENKRIAWKSITGPTHAGVVTFHHLDEHRMRLSVQLEFDPEGLAETVAAALPIVDSMVEYDLGKFKASIENETSAV